MRTITIDLDGTAVIARLLEREAPATCRRLWDLLPYRDRFTHSIWSGLMIHSNEHPRLDLDVSRYPIVENPVAFLAAGDVVVWPLNGSIGVAYGPTEFRWLTGAWVVTKVARIEGDIEPFARAAYRMMFEGARTVSLSRGGEARPAAEAVPSGKLVEIEYEGRIWIAELLEKEAPEYARAVWEALPLDGMTSVTHSSGEVLHFWCRIPEPVRPPQTRPKLVPVEHAGREIGVTSVAFDPLSMRGQHPGDLVWGSTWNGIRIVYGQGRFGGPGGKFGRIVKGDIAAFAERARRIPWDGSRVMKMRRHGGDR